MISCMTATRISTCRESPQNLLILPRNLTFHPLLWPNLPKKHPTFFPNVPYVHVYSPSLNPPPKFSKKRPLAAINDDFPPELSPYPDKPHPIDHLPVWPTNANDRWDPVTGHAWPCCCQRCIERPWKNPPPFVPDPYEQYE